MASGSRHGAPTLIKNGQPALALQRVTLGQSEHDGGRRESFIESLVHDHPDIIPMADIEPAFTPLISICRQLPTPAGYLDNLWMTPAGGIVLGECRLVKNPQARREVIAQALDYARAIGSWHYEDLETAVQEATHSATSLWSLVEPHAELDDSQFVDTVERRLRLSRFMILIIGDGIQEGVEALTSHLQLHAGLHVGLALVDLSIWRDLDGNLLVVPRVPLRTLLVERAVVLFDPSPSLQVLAPASPSPAKRLAPARAFTLSEQEFYDKLDERRPGLAGRVRSFVGTLSDLGISPEFTKSLILRWNASPDFSASPGYIDTWGKAWLSSAWNTANRLGDVSAGERYLLAIADAVSGNVKRYEKNWPEVVGPDGRGVDVAALLDVGNQWKTAIACLIAETRKAQAAAT